MLVDERFGGTWDDLRAAAAATDAPLLAKGFFTTEDDLRTAKDCGASAALLLLRDLDDAQTAHLMRFAEGLGLDTLVEAHDAEELDRGDRARRAASSASTRATSRPSASTAPPSSQLRRARSPATAIVIAESGISTRAQGAAAELAGANAILVGSALMQAPDPAAKLATLLRRPLVKVCGLTREEDVAAAAEAGADLLGFVLVPESPRAAPAVLPVPDDGALGRGLGRRGRRDAAPTSTRCTSARRARCAAATRRSSAAARRSPACSTCPGRRTTRRTGSAPRPKPPAA